MALFFPKFLQNAHTRHNTTRMETAETFRLLSPSTRCPSSTPPATDSRRTTTVTTSSAFTPSPTFLDETKMDLKSIPSFKCRRSEERKSKVKTMFLEET